MAGDPPYGQAVTAAELFTMACDGALDPAELLQVSMAPGVSGCYPRKLRTETVDGNRGYAVRSTKAIQPPATEQDEANDPDHPSLTATEPSQPS